MTRMSSPFLYVRNLMPPRMAAIMRLMNIVMPQLIKILNAVLMLKLTMMSIHGMLIYLMKKVNRLIIIQ